MKSPKIVIDTNVLICALRSNKGAAYKLIENLGTGKCDISLSVPLVIEYEAVAKREIHYLTDEDIDKLIDYICAIGDKRKIHYLWRPFLKDAKDDMILELAVESQSEFIITYNTKDFRGSENFGVKVKTPVEFLKIVGLL